MDIRHLRSIIAIAEAPSLSAASQELGIAQPSLSQHVQRLEAEIGVRLVDRSPRGAVLTEEGRVLLRHARTITAAMDACLTEMRDLGGNPRGRVGLGIPPSVSIVLSVPLAETVRVEAPDIRLHIIEMMSGYVKSWVDEGRVDVGFIYDLEGVDHFSAIHLMEERLFFFSAPDAWPLDSEPGEPVPLGSLQQVELILPGPSHGLRMIIDSYARTRRLALDVVIEIDALTQIKDLVSRGSGHTILSGAAAQDRVARGELVKSAIVAPEMTRPVYLVRNPAHGASRASLKIEELTLAVARDLVGRGVWEARLV